MFLLACAPNSLEEARTMDDLRRVRGIGPKTLERLRPYLLLEPPSRATSGFTDHARFGQGSLPWTSSSPANSSLPATSPKPSGNWRTAPLPDRFFVPLQSSPPVQPPAASDFPSLPKDRLEG